MRLGTRDQAEAADTAEIRQLGLEGAQGCDLFLPKLKLDIVVPDDQAEKVVLALQESCQTGKIGDGKIFVLPVEEAVRIRTGEHGEAAVTGS